MNSGDVNCAHLLTSISNCQKHREASLMEQKKEKLFFLCDFQIFDLQNQRNVKKIK